MDCFQDPYPNSAAFFSFRFSLFLVYLLTIAYFDFSGAPVQIVQLTTTPEECQCCNKIDRCGEVMECFGILNNAYHSTLGSSMFVLTSMS